jgi:hypothetical protein
MRLAVLIFHMKPRMLNQIGLKAVMSVPITQCMMHMQEMFPICCLRMWLNQLILKFGVLIMDAIISLFLKDHAVHDDTCCLHLPHTLHALGSSRVPNNSPL